MAAFYADAAPLARKLAWPGCDDLEVLGVEADLFKVGVVPEGIEPVLSAFRANIQHLNEIRAHTIFNKRGVVNAAIALMADEEGGA
jgi:hypothetical protein